MKSTRSTNTVWYRSKKNQAHELLEPYLKVLEQEYWQSDILGWERYLRMYGDNSYIGVLPSRMRGGRGNTNVFDPSLTWNVTRSLCKTAQTKICQAKPRPRFVTTAGDSKAQQNSKKLQKFIDAAFQAADVYTYGARAFLDACIFGSGFLKVLEIDGRIRVERVLISEILVDKPSTYLSRPLQLTHRKEVSRDLLKQKYPGYDDEIDALPTCVTTFGSKVGADLVAVKETWRLPTGDETGRHCITITDATLFDEDYNQPEFPIVQISWSEMPVGFFGNGIPSEVFGIQLTINRVLQQIVLAQDAICKPRWLVPVEGRINDIAINDKLGQLVHYSNGAAPQLQVSQAMPGEVYSFLDAQYAKAYELTGLSQQAAQAKREPGITSGAGLREVSDIQSDRLNYVSQSYERLYLQLAERFVDIAKEIVEEQPEFEVLLRTDIGLEPVQLKDIDLYSRFQIEMWPTNLLSNTPAGRMERILDMMNANLIGPDEAKRLLNFPDIQQAMDFDTASEDNFYKQIDLIIEESRYLPPEPFDDLQLGIKLYKQAFNRGKLNGLDQEKLELLSDFIVQAQDMLDQAQASTQQEQQQQPVQ